MLIPAEKEWLMNVFSGLCLQALRITTWFVGVFRPNGDRSDSWICLHRQIGATETRPTTDRTKTFTLDLYPRKNRVLPIVSRFGSVWVGLGMLLRYKAQVFKRQITTWFVFHWCPNRDRSDSSIGLHTPVIPTRPKLDPTKDRTRNSPTLTRTRFCRLPVGWGLYCRVTGVWSSSFQALDNHVVRGSLMSRWRPTWLMDVSVRFSFQASC